MKNNVRLLSYIPEIILIGFGIAFFFSPHLKVNTNYFPVTLITVVFIIQLIFRNNVLGLALGLLTTPVFLLLIIVQIPGVNKYARLLGEPFGVYAAHIVFMILCLIASLWLIRKYLLLHYHRSGK